MRYEWRESVHIPGRGDNEQFRTWGVDSQIGALLDGFPVDPQAVDAWPDEMLRLAERVQELEGIVAMRDGTLAMTVARLGGDVEGAPTHRGNFLQRIDQLVEDDGKWRKACLNYEAIKRQQEVRIAALVEERDRALVGWDEAEIRQSREE